MNFNTVAEPANAFAGQWAEPGAPTHKRSALAEGSGINAGDPVILGTDTEREVKVIGAASVVNAQTFAGFVVLETSRPYNTTMIADGDEVTVMDEGYLFLSASGTVTRGQEVILNQTTGALTGGAAGAAVAAGSCALPGCRWEADGSSGEKVKASIHLAGAAAGGVVASGTYAPTVAAIANVDGTPTVTNAMYQRIGDIVTVTGTLNVDPTAAAATATEVSLTLPFASDLGAAADLAGVASIVADDLPGNVEGDPTTNTARIKFLSPSTSALVLRFSFTYRIL